MNLLTPLAEAGRSYKLYASRLANLDIFKIYDFLFHIPHRYDDFSIISKISHIQIGEIITVQGEVTEIKNIFTKRFKKIQEAEVSDETGTLHIIWFNQPFITKAIHKGDKISLSGRVENSNGKTSIIAPEYEIISSDSYQTIHTGRLVPIYPETKGVSSKWLRRQVFKILQEDKEQLTDFLPPEVIHDQKLMEYFLALSQIHFPDTLPLALQARERLAFDEIFLIQLSAIQRKKEWQEKLIGNTFAIKQFEMQINALWESLPFELTFAQKKSLDDIFADMAKKQPMNRLLQGDVGSGKTVVAAIAMYVTFLNGYQSVLMAPTEILAGQHFKTIDNLLKSLGVKVALATATNKLKDDNFDMLIGTHSVLSDKINFEKLGLVVIDEQQRFGVEQRSIIKEKGINPHLLTMTATPIPRTVALTLYGDLDLSVLDEMPKGRKEIKTWLVPNAKREKSYEWIENQVKQGDQIFIVCPFIEESENMTTVKAATKEFETLQREVFPHLKIAMLHGKMKGKEKDQVLADFKSKKYDILVATPVVEVGIDIPTATVIVIEAAERFGLAQLHQLRGRVGRGDKQSYCLLFSESLGEQTRNRLISFQTMHIGSELAELDLRLRGAGEIYGTAQSGQRALKIANFGDLVLIEKAKKSAEKIFPALSKYPLLIEKLQEITVKKVSRD